MRKKSLQCVYQLAKKDPRVLFIGSDLGPEVLLDFKNEMPERFFMEGVSEAHVIGMAAGLAMEGYIPYVNTIGTFLTRRCYEQVVIDLCLHNLPVRLIGNGGGLVYAPLGPTHLAVEDIALMRVLPNMKIVSVADEVEMEKFMLQSLDIPGPVYTRLGKGNDPIITSVDQRFEFGKAIVYHKPQQVLLVSTGIMTHKVLAASELLKGYGIEAGVLHMPTIKPLDTTTLLQWVKRDMLVVTVEEHCMVGGLGSAVLECLSENLASAMPQVVRMGIPDHFIDEYGSQNDLLAMLQLHPEGIAARVLEKIKVGAYA